jgi:hypothetical protein
VRRSTKGECGRKRIMIKGGGGRGGTYLRIGMRAGADDEGGGSEGERSMMNCGGRRGGKD